MRASRLLAASAAGAMSVAAAHASPITIDDFGTNQTVVEQPEGSEVSSSEVVAEVGTEILGDYRDLSVEVTGGVNRPGASQLSADLVGLSHLNLENGTGISSIGAITWDGADGDATEAGVDTAGLGGLDLTAGGMNDRFALVTEAVDTGVTVTFRVWDLDSNTAESSVSFAGIAFGSEEVTTFLFDDFAGVDFTNLGAIQMILTGQPSVDAQFRLLQATNGGEVPVPSSLALFFTAVGAGGLVARRQRQGKAPRA